jgi:hypothetical protein
MLPAAALPLVAAAPLVMAHYMPWFASKPVSGVWGWHWTMGRMDPDKGESASHDKPLIGLYDSGDPFVLECQVQQLKLSGIDGVFVDWYGNVDHFDYGMIHRNTQKLFDVVRRAGMKFALVYEDQTVPQLIKGGKFPESEAEAQGKRLFEWVARQWFKSPTYLHEGGKPVLLVFGPQFYKPEQWRQILPGVAFYTLHHRRDPAIGAYDWPYPKGTNAREEFWQRTKQMPSYIPVAYPRFNDFYQEARVHESWGSIPDDHGRTYTRTLKECLQSGARIVQIATWNDWGEGTEIEPSERYGYRDLTVTQRLTSARYRPEDLYLPFRLLRLRRLHRGEPKFQERLSQISSWLLQGKTITVARELEALTAPGRS